MRYMLLIYPSEEPVEALGEEGRERMREDYDAFTRECIERGVYLGAEPLHPPSTARTVRVQAGERLITDGPFAETREHLAGYYMLECRNIDEALELAQRLPLPIDGSVEVREVLEIPGAHTEHRRAQEGTPS